MKKVIYVLTTIATLCTGSSLTLHNDIAANACEIQACEQTNAHTHTQQSQALALVKSYPLSYKCDVSACEQKAYHSHSACTISDCNQVTEHDHDDIIYYGHESNDAHNSNDTHISNNVPDSNDNPKNNDAYSNPSEHRNEVKNENHNSGHGGSHH